MWRHHGDQEPRRWFAEQRVIGSPKPQFLSLFFTKRHISSRVTTTTSALVDGSGSLRASSRDNAGAHSHQRSMTTSP